MMKGMMFEEVGLVPIILGHMSEMLICVID